MTICLFGIVILPLYLAKHGSNIAGGLRTR